jgi:hypothetical protein
MKSLLIVALLLLVGCIRPTFDRYRIIFCDNTNCPICAGYFDEEQ